jgi:hypothetical protein
MTSGDDKRTIPVERVKQLLTVCAQYFNENATDREIQNWIDDLVGAELADLRGSEVLPDLTRRELAKEILLKLIEIAPTAFDNANSESPNEGARLAWSIADAFLKAENS